MKMLVAEGHESAEEGAGPILGKDKIDIGRQTQSSALDF